MLIRNTKPSRFLFRIRSRHVPTGISKFGPNPRFWTQLSHPQWALAHLAEATLHRCGVHSRPPHRPGAAGIDRGTRISTGNHPQWPRKALRGPGAVFSRPAAQNSKKTFFFSDLARIPMEYDSNLRSALSGNEAKRCTAKPYLNWSIVSMFFVDSLTVRGRIKRN